MLHMLTASGSNKCTGFFLFVFFKYTEIVPCEGNITCGHGCLQTDEGAVCVCPEGSLLQEDGYVCTGMDGLYYPGTRSAQGHIALGCVELLLKRKVILQDALHQTEGAAVRFAILFHRLGGSAAVCQATSSTRMGSAALLLVSSI